MASKIEIFKPGDHTTMHGEQITFSEADVRASAQAYDPQLFEAPLVVGHPTQDMPAYGWVKDLAFADGVLQADPHQVEPQFAEMVKAGRFKKVSARFYRPDAAENPKPGTWYLRHVGFLGAAAPAVKGLKPAQFGADENGTVDFVAPADSGFALLDIARMFRQVREFLIDTFSREEADKVAPSYIIEDLETEARRPAEKSAAVESEFSEPATEENAMTKEELERRKKEMEQREAAFAEREKKFKEDQERLKRQAAESRQAEAVAFCESLVKEGKLLPAHQGRMAAFMTSLSDEATVEFGEGDGKRTESQLAAFKAFAKDLPATVDFGEVAGTSLGEPERGKGGGKQPEFSEDLTACV